MKIENPALVTLRNSALRNWLLFALAAAVASAVALNAAGLYGRASALAALEIQGHTDANIKVALLRAVLERPRALPFVLSRDSEVREALEKPQPAEKDRLNRKLEDLVAGTNASVMYVIGLDGIALSSSNWREATSFVGNDYTFREYFSRALVNGTDEHFALGSVSKRPGLYISHRIGPAAAPLGVVVVKMEFDQLESDWRDSGRPSFVTDENNVVLISSIPSWRFMTTAPLPPESLASIRESLQFGDASLVPLPLSDERPFDEDSSLITAVLPGTGQAQYLRITAPVSSTRWQFDYLIPVQSAIAAGMREARLIAILGLAPILLLAALWLRRRQMALRTIAEQQAARRELERRVDERTLDLSLARDRLQAEISDHKATDERLQTVQQDLVQANRLAILGQVAAGVAHEINQPVATIRAYADNAKVFIERQQTAPVIENLEMIAGLTERIGAITDDLKALARKGRNAAEPVELNGVIEGAIMLLKSRFTGRLEMLSVTPAPAGLQVMGHRLRLEQVFINLFQNALEAVGQRPDARVEVSTEIRETSVVITVSDNGPGIAPYILVSLFTPFNTSKDGGLGLGLIISKDIVADYGGQMDFESGPSGTRFLVHLQRASS